MKKIYYLGPSGSFSQIIVNKTNTGNNAVPCANFAEIVKNVIKNNDAVGILPIENSITSSVHENMDYLFKEDLRIISEAYLKIHLNLLGLKNTNIANITQVYSHPQALAQCAKYISQKNFSMKNADSTASAKKIIISENDQHSAVIGGKELTQDGQLIILDEDISDEKLNITRFLFVASDQDNQVPGVKNKASIMLTIPHKPGSLAKILTELANAKFNLTKIESRPIPTSTWEYQFWLDIENEKNVNLDEQILSDILKKNTRTYKLIGIYPSGNIYD